MSKKSKRKGYAGEKEFADLTGGKRVPLSGALDGLPNDVILPNGLQVEVKRRRDGFKQLYEWVLDEREKPDLVALRTDRNPWLITMTLDKFKELMGEELNGKSGTETKNNKEQGGK